jgi:hypothetical protein
MSTTVFGIVVVVVGYEVSLNNPFTPLSLIVPCTSYIYIWVKVTLWLFRAFYTTKIRISPSFRAVLLDLVPYRTVDFLSTDHEKADLDLGYPRAYRRRNCRYV